MNAPVNPFDLDCSSAAIGPGFYPGISNAEYHAGPGISKSGLDHIANNPSSYLWSQNAPVDEEKLKALDMGEALHCLLLERDEYENRFIVAPKFNLRTNAGKAGWEEFQALHQDKTIMTADEGRQLEIMYQSALAHPTVQWIFEQEGINEASIYWNDAETGELCRCRPDRILTEHHVIIDVKKVDGLERFEKHVEEFRYHVQDAMYSEGYHRHFGVWPKFMFLVVSSSISAGRYAVDVVDLPEDWKAVGHDLFRRDLERYHRCKQADEWLHVRTLNRPRWAAYND